MTIATFTIGDITIENNYPQIDIVENFYTSATERQALFIVIAVSKGVYTFVSAGESLTAEQNNVLDGICTNGTFSSKQAAAEAAFDLAVKTAAELETAFNAGYPVNKITKVSSTTKNYNYSKQNLACLALKAFTEAANEVLHIMIAEQADLQNEAIEIADTIAELSLMPDNADTELEYEALNAGAAFDNIEPIAISKHYELSDDIDELNETIDTIATEQADDLAAIDSEIAALKARLLSLGSTRQDIVEEYAHWHQVAQSKIDVLEYRESQDANEAYDDLRQSIWQATGQDIM